MTDKPKSPTAKELKEIETMSALVWAYRNNLKLTGGTFDLINRKFQGEWLTLRWPKNVDYEMREMTWIKGTQLGISEVVGIIIPVHGAMTSRYNTGVYYFMPSLTASNRFSAGRYSTIINANKFIRSKLSKDAVEEKCINGVMIYFGGARATQKIEGLKATSTQTRSVPCDALFFDEKDMMDQALVEEALFRIGDSDFKEVYNFSTPSIPGYGIDYDYQRSDRRVWVIKCRKCNTETVLELSFPECLMEVNNRVIKVCDKCKNEIYSNDGIWVPRSSDVKNHVGYWISRLNSPKANMNQILNKFYEVADKDPTEFYNSNLGMPYVSAENKLLTETVLSKCKHDPMPPNWVRNQCAMGVDVGKVLHVVIGYPLNDKQYKILKVARVSSFNDVHDLAKDFNVGVAVIDAMPETRKVRDFQQAESYKIFLCYYQDTLKHEIKVDKEGGIMAVNRTEICDETHFMFQNNHVLLPRESPEIRQYAEEMCNIAKVVEVDEFTKARTYKYKSLSKDHYRHATNYFKLACKDNTIMYQPTVYDLDPAEDEKAGEWNPLEMRK